MIGYVNNLNILLLQHVTAFNHIWGRPGGGAPRTNTNNELDASPRSYGTLNTFMTHQGQNKFRRL